MSEFKREQLGCLVSVFRAGGTPASDLDDNYGGDIPFVAIEDMTGCSKYLAKTKKTLTSKGLESSAAWLVPPGHILYSMYATLGKTRINTVPVATNQAIAAFFPDPKKISVEYLYYALENLEGQIYQFTTQTTQSNLNGASVKGLWIEYPIDLPTQRRIAEILSTLDAQIAATEALIAKHQQIKAGLMQDLFTRGIGTDGKLRATREEEPGLYRETGIGWVPKGWEVKRLGDILQESGGYLQTGPFGSQLHAHEYQTEGVPVVMPQDINDGVVGVEYIARIHEARASELARHRMRLGDIVIARRGDLSRAAAIDGSQEDWICGTGCFLLRLQQSALRADFAAHVYRQNFIQRQIDATCVGTTMPSLNNSVMSALLFPFVEKREQTRIVECLDDADRGIQILRDGWAVNQKIKMGLMDDLLTGKVQTNLSKKATNGS